MTNGIEANAYILQVHWTLSFWQRKFHQNDVFVSANRHKTPALPYFPVFSSMDFVCLFALISITEHNLSYYYSHIRQENQSSVCGLLKTAFACSCCVTRTAAWWPLNTITQAAQLSQDILHVSLRHGKKGASVDRVTNQTLNVTFRHDFGFPSLTIIWDWCVC